jgi:hypothetical protein
MGHAAAAEPHRMGVTTVVTSSLVGRGPNHRIAKGRIVVGAVGAGSYSVGGVADSLSG